MMTKALSDITLSVAFSYCYAECRYAECRYAECRCARKKIFLGKASSLLVSAGYCGLCYKHIMIVNEDSSIINK
jgi:hypothetical protein